jgi:nucleotide-binding universal stress UspA family protein
MHGSRRPIIVALDPRRHDLAPAALGVMLARLHRAPLVLAGADLLVCGSRGHAPVRSLRRPRILDGLLREAACPVIVVPSAPAPF